MKAKDNWTYSWEAEDDGASWTVSEPTTPLGYTQLTTKQNRNNDNKTLNFRVTNQANADVTPAPRQLSVVKYWNHKDGTSLTEDEIGIESLPIRIYRKREGGRLRLDALVRRNKKGLHENKISAIICNC